MRQLLFCGTQIRLRFDKHMSWLVIFCWKGGKLPKHLKFEEHMLEQKL